MFIRMKNSFTWLRNWFVKRHARNHAKNNVEPMPDAVVVKHIGPEIVIDTENNTTHKRLHEESQVDPRVAKWEKEKSDVEKERTNHSSRPLLWVAFVFLLIVEFAGISQLLASQGMENPERTIVALAGSCILFYLTYKASKQAVTKKKSVWFYALMAAIAALVFSVALLRRDETSTEDTSSLLNLASALFMTIVTLGPGLLAKEVFAALIPIEQLSKNHRRLRNEIKRAAQKQERAKRQLDNLELWRVWWVREAAQIKSTYDLAYAEAGGRVNNNPYRQ